MLESPHDEPSANLGIIRPINLNTVRSQASPAGEYECLASEKGMNLIAVFAGLNGNDLEHVSYGLTFG